MPGSCEDCKNCMGFHDEGYGTGEYICKLDDSPGGCPECEGNGPCPGWVSIETPTPDDTHKIAFTLRNCIAVSVLADIADMMDQMPKLDMNMDGEYYPTFILDLDFEDYCYFKQEFDWATDMTCDMDQDSGLNYLMMEWEKNHKTKETKE